MRSAVLGQDSKITVYMHRLQELVDNELRMVSSITLVNTQRIEASTQKIAVNTKQTQSNTEIIIESLSGESKPVLNFTGRFFCSSNSLLIPW